MHHRDRGRRYGASPSSDAEFVGRVDSVGAEPQFLSGVVTALQPVGMTITDVRRGTLLPGDILDVDVEIVAGNPHVAIGDAGLPALDPTMVQPGVLLLAYANKAGDRWRAVEVSTDGPSSANYAGRTRYRG
jgi:hypothetical protein